MRNAYKKLIINQRRNNKIINELKVDEPLKPGKCLILEKKVAQDE